MKIVRSASTILYFPNLVSLTRFWNDRMEVLFFTRSLTEPGKLL